MQSLFKIIDKEIYFPNVTEAQTYAKEHPGETIRRCKERRKRAVMAFTPTTILNHLNKYIISQDKAKREIASVIYYHSLRIKYKDRDDIKNGGPVMLVGPTGSGKTFIVKKACTFIDVAFVHADVSSMVSEGIVGFNIGKLAASILINAKLDIQKASYCIVFLDEIDKLFFSDDNEYGEEVSNQLLRFIEGTEITVPGKDIGITDSITIPTDNMQFILGGAFQWIVDQKSAIKKDAPGFLSAQTKEIKSDIVLDDLYKADVPKELLGRISTIINTHKLSQEECYNILTKGQESPLKEFTNKIKFHGDTVEISDVTIQKVAKAASKSDLGARAIKQILKNMFNEALFNAPNKEFQTHYIKFKGLD